MGKRENLRLTQPSPLPQHLPIGHLDQRDIVLPAQCNHKLLVSLFLARLVQHAHVGLSSIERFGSFAEAAGEAIIDEGEFQDTFQGFKGGLRVWFRMLVFDFFKKSHLIGELGVLRWREVSSGCGKEIIWGSITHHLGTTTGSRRVGSDLSGLRVLRWGW